MGAPSPGFQRSASGQKPAVLKILLVEDNPADIRLTREALDESRHPYELSVANDGVKALDFLREVVRTGTPKPDLILLDWNLPRMDGKDVLRTIKNDADLRTIPVVVLTTSRAQTDILSAYELHANCFITKSVDVIQFFRMINEIESFWSRIASLPK